MSEDRKKTVRIWHLNMLFYIRVMTKAEEFGSTDKGLFHGNS